VIASKDTANSEQASKNNKTQGIRAMLTQYTQSEAVEADQSEVNASKANRAIKESKAIFINLQKDGEYVNTLDDSSAYIKVSRCHNHRIGNHEETGVTVSLVSPVANTELFVPAPKVWARFWVYGGKAIDHRYYSVMPAKESIDQAVGQLRCKYEAAING
jgi:hypothetical protein